MTNSILEAVFPITLLGKEYSSKPTDLTDRTTMFKELWDKYLAEPGHTKVKQFGRKHSLNEFWHYQIRGAEVRFADEDMALLFRLTL